jgi:hypothetical protein
VSNGSTATIPPTPALPAPPQILPSSDTAEEKDLPPPPPAKSARRKTQKQTTGNQQSRGVTELARNDSLLSPAEPKAAVRTPSEAVEVAPVIKRKALPDPALKKFRSLAELGQGPRGGKGGPLPSISAPRKASVDSEISEPSQQDNTNPVNEVPQEVKQVEVAALGQLPPTPDEDKDTIPLAPPRKVFTGLPSNPRAKGPASPLYIRNKSSTGFNILKVYTHISFPAPVVLR